MVKEHTSGSDQSWGKAMVGSVTNEDPGYNEDLAARRIIPAYFR
jgi:hypothetical protein